MKLEEYHTKRLARDPRYAAAVAELAAAEPAQHEALAYACIAQADRLQKQYARGYAEAQSLLRRAGEALLPLLEQTDNRMWITFIARNVNPDNLSADDLPIWQACDRAVHPENYDAPNGSATDGS